MKSGDGDISSHLAAHGQLNGGRIIGADESQGQNQFCVAAGEGGRREGSPVAPQQEAR